MKLRYLLLCFLYIVFAPLVFGQASTIKINEFLIEPIPQIVELLNTGTEIVDLSNWYVDDNGGTTYLTIPAGTVLYPNACISFTGSFNLNRTSADTVRLFDSTAPPTSISAKLVDSFDYKASSGSGITFQRIPDGQSVWSTGSANFDLYNLTGLSCKVEPTIIPSPLPTSVSTPSPQAVQATTTPIPTTSPTATLTPTSLPTSESVPSPQAGQATPTPTPEIKAIYLSEVYPYPNENETEWVELFNDNAFSIFLDNWKIDDVSSGGSSPKKFSLTIPGYSFKTIDLTNSIFNNDGDDVRLLNTNDSLVDSFSYDDVEKGKSIGRISFSSTKYCMQNSSMEYSNNSCMTEPTPLPTSVQATLITTTITPIPTVKKYSTDLNRSVLGTSIDSSSNNNYEPVRPTQYYERPMIVEEKSLEDYMKSDYSETENSPDNHAAKVAKTSALVSALASFLTAGFIFIRIIL